MRAETHPLGDSEVLGDPLGRSGRERLGQSERSGQWCEWQGGNEGILSLLAGNGEEKKGEMERE